LASGSYNSAKRTVKGARQAYKTGGGGVEEEISQRRRLAGCSAIGGGVARCLFLGIKRRWRSGGGIAGGARRNGAGGWLIKTVPSPQSGNIISARPKIRLCIVSSFIGRIVFFLRPSRMALAAYRRESRRGAPARNLVRHGVTVLYRRPATSIQYRS